MSKKIILAVLIVCLVVGITFFIRMNQNGYENTETTSGQESNSSTSASHETTNPGATSGVSKEELALHNKQSDCWVAYDGKVYDITSFLPNHPGSAGAIAPYCGTSDEFKKAFEKQHGTSKVKTLMRVGVFMGDFDVMGDLQN